MNYEEASKIIEKLRNACVFHRFLEAGVMAEYTRFLKKYNYDRMNEAVDKLLTEVDSKNVPAISELYRTYKNINTVTIDNIDWCDVCNDRGFIPVKEMMPVSETEKAVYEVIYYCPFCNKGHEFNYDGTRVEKKENQSKYKTYPITTIYDDAAIDRLRTENIKTRARNEAARELRKKHKLQGKKFNIGQAIPNIKF